MSASRREYGTVTALAFVVGTVIGTGVYLKPAQVTRMAPEPWQNLLLWLLGGVFALCGALVYARLAAVWPNSGGAYVYLRECYGNWVSCLLMAADVLLARPAAVGALATGIGLIWEFEPALTLAVAGGTLLALTVAQLVGRKATGSVQVLLTILQMVPLLLVAGAGTALRSTSSPPPGPAGEVLWASGFLAVLWAYDGWYNITIMAGDVERPEVNVRRALVGGVVMITLVYVGLNALLLAKIPRAEIVSQGLPFLSLLRGWGMEDWIVGIKWGLTLALLSTLNGVLVCGPKMLHAGQLDGLLKGRGAAVGVAGERLATVLFSGWCLALLLLFAALPSKFALFDQLSEYTAVVVAGLSGLTVSCLFRLKRFGQSADAWTLLAGIVFLLVDALLTVMLAYERPWLALGGTASVLAAGTLLWFLSRSRTGRLGLEE